MTAPEPRRIALSDPLATADTPARFVVGGHGTQSSVGDVKMYEWRRDKGEMVMVGLRMDIGQIRSIAWSPHPSHRHLIATGLTSGKTIIHNVTPSTLSLPLSSMGSSSSTSNTIATLSGSHPRPVTSLSFSFVDPNYIATAHEKHRSDYSLLIWDIADALSASCAPVDGNGSWQRPPDRLSLVGHGAKLSTTGNSDARPVQQYCPSELVNCVSFLPHTQHLLASSAYKFIRLLDLRTPTPPLSNNSPRDPSTSSASAGAQSQWSTRAIYGLKPNPAQGNLFASYETAPGTAAGSNVVRLWDSRKAGIEVLSFDVPKGGIMGLEWMGSSGKLGVSTREGGIGLWEILNGTPYQSEDGKTAEWITIAGMRQIVKPKQNLHSFAFAPRGNGQGDVMYVIKDGSIGIGPIDSAPTLASGSQGQVATSAPSLRVIDPDATATTDAEIGADAGVDGPETEIEHRGREREKTEETDEPRRNRFQLAPQRVTELLAERSRSSSPAFSHNGSPGLSVVEKKWYDDGPTSANEDRVGIVRGWDGWRRMLGSDVGVVMRRRAMEGYGLDDLLLNAAIATRHPGKERLAGIWEFVNHLTEVMSPRFSSTEGYDLTHQGVFPVWIGIHNEPKSLIQSDHSRSHTSDGGYGHESNHTAAMHDPPFGPGHGQGHGKGQETGKQGSAAWTSLKSQSSSSIPHSRQQSAAHTNTSVSASHSRRSSRERERKISDREEIDLGYLEAISVLNKRREEIRNNSPTSASTNVSLSRHVINSQKGELRKLVLIVCGENDQGKDERAKLAQSGQRTKAAFKSYFAGDEAGTVQILMSSEDTQHHLLGSTIAGFMTQSASARGSEFFNSHWPGLVNRVEDPFVRAILNRIGGDEWESVLEEEGIPLLDRIAVGAQHLDDREFTAFLRSRQRKCTLSTSLHMLAITGLSAPSISLLNRYLTRTGDLQTVSLLSSLVPTYKLNEGEKKCVERWIEGYRDLLDSWGLWGERCAFDVKREEVMRALSSGRENGIGGKVGSCPVCNNPLTRDTEERLHRKNAMRGTVNVGWPSERTTTCIFCQAPLPRCVICLTHVDPHRPSPKDAHEDHFEHISDTIDSAYVCCLTCRHGGHANHILPWFEGDGSGLGMGHDTCPVAGCDCQCASI